MFQNPVRKRRSMLGKRCLKSKPRPIPYERITTCVLTDDRPTFSASRPSSTLGQRLLAENSSTVRKQNQKHSERNSSTKKNPVNIQSSQYNNVRKNLFGSAFKVDKEFNAELQGNINDSPADLSGITDLPMYSTQRSDCFEMQLKKKSTLAKTPSRLRQELPFRDRTRFTLDFSTLEPPVSPPQLYDMYMTNRTQNYTAKGQLPLNSVSKLKISTSTSPKLVGTNSAYKKPNYRSWENVTTMTKSPKSCKNSQTSCENLSENQSITTNSTQRSDYFEMQLKKKSTLAKTPSCLHKELPSRDGTRFTSGFPTLEPPVSPPQLYDMYMKNRTQNYTAKGQLPLNSVSKLKIFTSNSPKLVDTNSAYKKPNYRSWENVTTMTKSSKSYKNSQTSCENHSENQSITTNSTQRSDYFEMQLKKKSTLAKTPSCLHKELTSRNRKGLNPYRFTSGFPTLEPPISPPQLYDMYMKNRTQNYTAKGQLLPNFVSKPKGQLLPNSVSKPNISTSNSPKLVDTNSAYKKPNYRSWENVTTMSKSSKSYMNSQTGCENLSENQSITTNSTQKKLNRTMSLESLCVTNKPIENKTNACKHLNCTNNFENLSSASIAQAIEKDNLGGNGIYKSKSWSIISSVVDETDFQQKNKKDSNNSSTANSTVVVEYENPDDSFIYNEIQSMIEYETKTEEIITNKINQLSLIQEEEEARNTLKLEQTICDEDEADLTLKPSCNLPYSITDKVNNISNPISSVKLLETSIKAMAKENTELLVSFQREILNEYSVKLKETLHEVIKEQTIVRNKVIQDKLENFLQDKLQIFKNNLKNQSEEFTKLLDHLKSRFVFVNDKISHDMQSQSKIMIEENKKLVEQFQKEVFQDFENKMLLIVNKSTYKQIDIILNAVKEDLDIAQKIEIKKQECLTNLEFFRTDKENVSQKERECQEYKEKVECLHSVLNSFTDLNCDLINDYKNHLVFELQNKIEIVSKNMIEQQVDDILHVFQTILQDKLNLFVPKLNFLSEKWSSFKIDVMKNDNSFQNSVETAKSDICSGTTTVRKSELKSPRKIENTRKMYSDLRSQFKFCLKTPKPLRGRIKHYSRNTSSALTPCSLSNIVYDQISQLLDS